MAGSDWIWCELLLSTDAGEVMNKAEGQGEQKGLGLGMQDLLGVTELAQGGWLF